MLLEAVRIFVAVISGGAAGAFITDWLRRRAARIQTIPLIERVSRFVNPEIEGFTLARVVVEGQARRLEEVRTVREYQLTLRNTSTVHLRDAEIQFEFGADNVDAWVGRPTRSKTAPVPVNAAISVPWRKAFRWRIPEFPSTDSIEFTFRAIDPTSNEYEVALYNSGPVVIERSNVEHEMETRKLAYEKFQSVVTALMGLSAVAFVVLVAIVIHSDPQDTKATVVDWAGCSLKIKSSYVNLSLFPDAAHGISPPTS
jgi:hypothetical protein